MEEILFSDDWLKCVEFKGWLQKVLNNDLKAHCTACKVVLNAGKSDLLKHAAGKKHIENLKVIKNSRNIEESFKNTKPEQSVAVKETEIRLASFFAEHNVAFQVADHLLHVMKKSFYDSNIAQSITLNRTKCTSIIKNVLNAVETDETVNNLKNVKFSILVDESTDNNRP
ncbi:uncharacterized protein LOC103309756 [Acyrthosiphon pisum]|uniref:Uncharacterized protein n=1 Tax=Acyrthosiphon pisum TaxID=7029 RepID=A0A8R2FAV9_ACYPI|nr:uncharacterized protein LOC103309756 [Acyrthosiphon pisum]|eukprot:XP_008184253.1 PREDICTED: uncharacterized protein LOC103309756 [Acyrthosiphon pisum]